MIRNFLKYYIASVKKNIFHYALNIIGLTIGISGFLILVSYVQHELSYDKSIANSENIYRVVTDVKQQKGMMQTCLSSSYIARNVAEQIPEIKASTRITPSIETLLTTENKSIFEDGAWYVDSAFFNVFNLPLLQGKADDVLSNPFSMVVTEEIAEKYFGNQNPVGRQIRVGDRWDYTITGVMDAPPSNFHLDISLLMTGDSVGSFRRTMPGALALYTYVSLVDGAQKDSIAKKMNDFLISDYGEEWKELVIFGLEQIQEIHLKSFRLHEFAQTADSKQIYLLLIIGLLLLVISIANYINIMTARSEYRSREAAIRKVSGASNRNLLYQFYFESFANTFVAGCLSVFVVYFTWPMFCEFIDKELMFPLFSNWYWFVGFIIILSLVSGSYPALAFSSIKPIKGIQFYIYGKANKTNMRRIMVVVQFALAAFVVFSTIVIYTQLQFLFNKDKGFDEENVAILTLRDRQMIDRMDFVKNELMKIPEVKSISCGGSRLTNIFSGQRSYSLNDSSNDFTGADFMVRTTFIDQDFIPMNNMKLLAGRNFDPLNALDTAEAVIINQAAARNFGLANPIGEKLNDNNGRRKLKIVGLVKDFHYQSMHQEIEPLIFRYNDQNMPFVYIKFHKISNGAIAKVQSIWNELTGVFPFQLNYLKEDFQQMHSKEEKMRMLYVIFSAIALIIASLGLYGLTAYITEKRTKEIGVRKVLGAKTRSIFIVLSKQYFIWVFIANIISWPFAYIAMRKWLQSFAYVKDVSWWVFALTILLTGFITFATITFIIAKAIRMKPVICLKSE